MTVYHGTSASVSRVLTPLTVLVVANAVSLTGNVIATVAIPWLVLTTTGSAALAGIAIFAGAGAAAVGGLVAGRIVDAVGPTRTSAGADLLSALAVAPLPILLATGSLELWHVVVLAIAGTLADAAGSTARQSLVPAAADASGTDPRAGQRVVHLRGASRLSAGGSAGRPPHRAVRHWWGALGDGGSVRRGGRADRSLRQARGAARSC